MPVTKYCIPAKCKCHAKQVVHNIYISNAVENIYHDACYKTKQHSSCTGIICGKELQWQFTSVSDRKHTHTHTNQESCRPLRPLQVLVQWITDYNRDSLLFLSLYAEQTWTATQHTTQKDWVSITWSQHVHHSIPSDTMQDGARRKRFPQQHNWQSPPPPTPIDGARYIATAPSHQPTGWRISQLFSKEAAPQPTQSDGGLNQQG